MFVRIRVALRLPDMGTVPCPTYLSRISIFPKSKMFHPDPAAYKSFLVRLWRPEKDVCWRATVRHVISGKTWHFEDLERLYLFLHEQTDGADTEQAEED